MNPSITEVFSHLALGTLVSLVCTLDTVGSHPLGLISGINRDQNPIFVRFLVALLLPEPRGEKSHEISPLKNPFGPFCHFLSLCLYEEIDQQYRCACGSSIVKRDLGSVCTDTWSRQDDYYYFFKFY